MEIRAALLIEARHSTTSPREQPESSKAFKEIAEFLQDPNGGDYNLTILKNLNQTTIRSEIEVFFSARDPNDTLLLYFTGYGSIDTDDKETQNLYLHANDRTAQPQQFEPSKTLSTMFIKHHIDLCDSQRIIIILDCSISSTVIHRLNQDNINTIQDLAAPKTVILASFQPPQAGSNQARESFNLTQALLHCAQDSHPSDEGWITGHQICHDIHQKLNHESNHKGHFKFFCDEAQNHIFVAKGSQPNSKLEYRKEVDRIYRELDQELYLEFDGVIRDPLDLGSLKTYRDRCGLSTEEALIIEQQVQKPYLKQAKNRREYAKYVQIISKSKSPLTAKTWKRISEIRSNLALGEYDTKRIEAKFGLFQPQKKAPSTPIPRQPKPSSQPPPPLATPQRPSKNTEIPNIRYEALEKYLSEKDWKAADYETYRLMIQQTGKEEGEWFQIKELLNYPCEDLMQIDQRWVRYSNGRFGFSVQLQLWQEHHCPQAYSKEWKLFGERVGWRTQDEWLSYQSLTPSLESSRGHLPMGGFTSDCVLWDAAYRSWGWTFNEIFYVSLFLYFSSLMNRFSTCSPISKENPAAAINASAQLN